ncbi:hypothetical protein [Streptomyces sp. UH6]|uniref:hypothetical protein n=1 Tax=Streptomyces sp. UH6 TaxID=2748379 RepID=UPI0015D4B009|nr:hypothetical protein [Streptomyces sp. UH6]NYV74251.1 hypothetical protein [Streptomyces sp. UH6]
MSVTVTSDRPRAVAGFLVSVLAALACFGCGPDAGEAAGESGPRMYDGWFDTSRDGLRKFLADSGQADLALFDGTFEGEEREWQTIPEGEHLEGGSYSNRIGECDNSVTVRVRMLRDDEVRIHLGMACAS